MVFLSARSAHAQPFPESLEIVSLRSGATLTLDRFSLQMVYTDTNQNDDARSDSSEIARLSFDFDDSSGNFIPPSDFSRELRTIRIPLEHIHSMSIREDELLIKYNRPVDMPIESVRDRNGAKVLDQFSYTQLIELKRVFSVVKNMRRQ